MGRTRWIMVATVVACCNSAAAESLDLPPDKTAGTVRIEFVSSVTAHASRDDLRSLCRADYPVEGCTRFPSEALDCHCKRRNDEWVIDISARVEAAMQVPRSSEYARVVAHERRHLVDLEDRLREYLDSMALRSYESEATCRRMAEFLSVSSHLTVVMNTMRVASNAKFGCSRDAQ